MKEKKRQGAYNIVDEMFRCFVVNNQKILDGMEDEEIFPVKKFSACLPYLKIFEIRHVAKYNCVEGPCYAFLTDEFDKIYNYYDVE